uniref:LIM and SH3 domain protein 1 n=1 Tax=Sinocyclocheilus rhinocerous TaxID=307959 RepID=A0A673N2C1_9TELE
MNVQKCARCGFVVYPAEKINLIGQNWHKACFHCEVCKMVLTANNFVSHQKRPYCQVHNPKNNTFTSVYETPVNINAKKQSEAASEVRFCLRHRLTVHLSTIVNELSTYFFCNFL